MVGPGELKWENGELVTHGVGSQLDQIQNSAAGQGEGSGDVAQVCGQSATRELIGEGRGRPKAQIASKVHRAG